MRTLFTMLVLVTCWFVHGAQAGTNLISIHLLDTPVGQPWPKLDAAHLKDLKPLSQPALADSDFLAFDPTNHTFVITSAAAKRLASSIWSLGRKDDPGRKDQGPPVFPTGYFDLIPEPAPFVLKAFGEPIYAGAFFTQLSSAIFGGPVIMPQKMFISTNAPENATVSFSIQLGYPGPFPGPPDPRSDPRIISAAQKLFAK